MKTWHTKKWSIGGIPGGRKLTKNRLKKKRAKYLTSCQRSRLTSMLDSLDHIAKRAAATIPNDFAPTPEDIKRLERYDPIAEVEPLAAIFGTQTSQLLAMRNHVAKTAQVDKLLKLRGDTTGREGLAKYQAIITAAGFELALEDTFSYVDKWDKKTYTEQFFVYHRNGQVLCFDTYRGNVNGGNVYYTWKPNGEDYPDGITSSCSWDGNEEDGYVLVGHHDCRQGLIMNMEGLAQHGTFLPVMAGSAFIWMLSHADTMDENYNHSAITLDRIKRSTQPVQDCLALVAAKLEGKLVPA